MSYDGFAETAIGFKPVELMELLNSQQDSPRENVDFNRVLLDSGSEEDTEYVRELFNLFLNDYLVFISPDDRWKYEGDNKDDLVETWKKAALFSYTEISAYSYDEYVKEFFNKYKDVLDQVDIQEEFNTDELYLFKIENRKKNGKHFLVSSPATIKFENFKEF